MSPAQERRLFRRQLTPSDCSTCADRVIERESWSVARVRDASSAGLSVLVTTLWQKELISGRSWAMFSISIPVGGVSSSDKIEGSGRDHVVPLATAVAPLLIGAFVLLLCVFKKRRGVSQCSQTASGVSNQPERTSPASITNPARVDAPSPSSPSQEPSYGVPSTKESMSQSPVTLPVSPITPPARMDAPSHSSPSHEPSHGVPSTEESTSQSSASLPTVPVFSISEETISTEESVRTSTNSPPPGVLAASQTLAAPALTPGKSYSQPQTPERSARFFSAPDAFNFPGSNILKASIRQSIEPLYDSADEARDEPKGRSSRSHSVQLAQPPSRMNLSRKLRRKPPKLNLDMLKAEDPLLDMGRKDDEEDLKVCTSYLSKHDLHMLAHSVVTMKSEFKDIPMNSCRDAVGLSAGKNRYTSILPTQETRVRLEELNGDINTTYINANYIRGYRDTEKAYIATQGPLPSTVEDFWRMVWEHRSNIIIMVITEEEIEQRKTEIYWPGNEDGATVKHGRFTIQRVGTVPSKGYTVTNFEIAHDTEPGSHLVRHYWYYHWPDHGVPKTARGLLRLIRDMHRYLRDRQQSSTGVEDVNGPVVVHCSAGLGRTGTVIAMDICCRQLKYEEGVDVKRTLAQMRLQRGGVIQNDQQYVFLHDALNLYDFQQSNEHALASSSVVSLEGLQLPCSHFRVDQPPAEAGVSAFGARHQQRNPFHEPTTLSGSTDMPSFQLTAPSASGGSEVFNIGPLPPASPSAGGAQGFSFDISPVPPGSLTPPTASANDGEAFTSHPKSPSATSGSHHFPFDT